MLKKLSTIFFKNPKPGSFRGKERLNRQIAAFLSKKSALKIPVNSIFSVSLSLSKAALDKLRLTEKKAEAE